MVGRREGLRREDWNGGRGRRSGLLDPLREGVARAPGVLTIKEKALTVQAVGAVFGLHIHAAAGGAGSAGLDISGDAHDRTDGGFTDGKASAGPGLSHALRFGNALTRCGLPRRSG